MYESRFGPVENDFVHLSAIKSFCPVSAFAGMQMVIV